MRWNRGCAKGNGELRRQFLQWQVPKEVREFFDLKDGNECYIIVQLGAYRYIGKVILTSGVEFRLPREVAERLRGLAGKARGDSIAFDLSPYASLEGAEQELGERVAESLKLSSAERSKRLASAPKHPAKIEVVTIAFLRNPDVVAEVLERANGVCGLCHSTAPFIRVSNGTPYLEVHHKVRLADGGEDTVENAMALCPNCHREAHYG